MADYEEDMNVSDKVSVKADEVLVTIDQPTRLVVKPSPDIEAFETTYGEEVVAKPKWYLPRLRINTRKRVQVPVKTDTLKEEVGNLMVSIGDVLDSASDQIGKYQLQTVEIKAEITGEGKVSILGSGGSLSATGGITFSFERKEGG